MKRRLDICRRCSCFRRVSRKSNMGNLYCFHEAFFDGNGDEIGVAWFNLHHSHDWNKADIAENCDCYAEYFVEECNEKKA